MISAFSDKGKRPLESVDEFRQCNWMFHLRKCFNAHHCLCYICNRTFISMGLGIVRSRENSQSQRNVHILLILKAFSMHLVSPDNHLQTILTQKILGLSYSKIERTLPSVICDPFLSHIIDGITPKQITKSSLLWHLSKPVQLLNLIQLLTIWRNPSMHSKVFLINYGSDGQLIEYVHDLIIDTLVVLR